MIRYFSFLVLDKMPVTTSPEKVGHRCCFLELARVEEKLGRKPIMYSRQNFLEKLLRKDINELAPYALWVSHYTNADKPLLPSAWLKWTFWQYTDTGNVRGISGRLDFNFFNGSIDDLRPFPRSMKVRARINCEHSS